MTQFYLGMDIGTESVGMACTDEEYNLLRAKGKDCWSVRLFDASKTAEERRTARTARRRLERRKFRIGMLQYLFDDYIDDETFFLRLNNSGYRTEDKDPTLGGGRDSLFSDPAFRDKDYHRLYPTIFHLRKALTEGTCDDLRLYYLGLHHIVKYRGHFLWEGGMDDVRNVKKVFNTLNTVIDVAFDEDKPFFDPEKAEQAKVILLSGKKTIRDKKAELEKLFCCTSKIGKEMISGFCGKVSPKKIFEDKYQEEENIDFTKFDDEKFDALRTVYEEDFVVLEALRSVYNYITFEKILAGKGSISEAMVSVYDKHHADLFRLKEFFRNNTDKQTFEKVFLDEKEGNNYAHYVGYTKIKKKKIKVKKCKPEEFFAYLKKMLTALRDTVRDTSTCREILKELEEGTFLPKILHEDNGLFPHQINEDELRKIVQKMVERFPETSEMAKKILPLFLFRIPYYVGPLGENGWAVRNSGHEGEKITPWNFDEIIDKPASNEEFMRRMTSECSYLHAEDVLPKGSCYYQKYNVLNQINKLLLNDCPLKVEAKQAIYRELCLTHVKITDKGILDVLVRNGFLSKEEKSTAKISGKDGDLKGSMSSYIQLKKILGSFVDDDYKTNGGVCEKIIHWHTLNTDKKIVEDLIRKNYGDIPVIRDSIAKLKGLTFSEFGKLSKKFLSELRAETEDGEWKSILELLYETNENLNELLFNEKYGFQEKIRAENGEESTDVSYKDVEKLYVSPAVRRGIYQSLRMADEYVQALGKTPDKIFVEVTREEGVKGDAGRTVSRKRQLETLYADIKGIEKLLEELKTKTDADLRSERLYLYFRQLGRCMYSGEEIDLVKLMSKENLYDVDHILPRTYIKDDSLDNKVLVLRKKNEDKKDNYPIPFGLVTESAKYHWKVLREKHLLSDTTYNRLMRNEPLTDDDYQGFINRQKVITDQTAKAVLELMKRKYPEAKVVYSKAGNVSDFKHRFKLIKCRETNDLHHARDAYLNIVVGNVFDTCFSTPWGGVYRKDDAWHRYRLDTLFTRNVKGAWIQDNAQTITLVKRVFVKTSMMVTRYAYTNKGNFYKKTTLLPKGDPTLPPIKGKGVLSNPEKYGGHEAINNAFLVIVETKNKKGTAMKCIYAVPVLVALQEKQTGNAIEKYLEDVLHLQNYCILVRKLKYDSLVSIDGFPFWIAGGCGIKDSRLLLHNACQWFTDQSTDDYVKAISKLLTFLSDEKREKEEREKMKERDEFLIRTNRFHDIKTVINHQNNLIIFDEIIRQLEEKKIYQYSYSVLSSFKSVLQDMKEKRDYFVSLSTYKQSQCLSYLVNFLKANSGNVNLSLLGGSATAYTLRCSNNITNFDFRIIHQSPCGLTIKEEKV